MVFKKGCIPWNKKEYLSPLKEYKKYFEEKYFKDGWSMSDIAQDLKCHIGTIRRWFKRLGILRRTKEEYMKMPKCREKISCNQC